MRLLVSRWRGCCLFVCQDSFFVSLSLERSSVAPVEITSSRVVSCRIKEIYWIHTAELGERWGLKRKKRRRSKRSKRRTVGWQKIENVSAFRGCMYL